MTRFQRLLSPVLLGSFALVASLDAQAPTIQGAQDHVLSAFDLEAGTVQRLTLPASSTIGFEVEVDLAGALHTLRVHPHDLRADDFQLWVEDEAGMHLAPTPPSVTFRGKVLGLENSIVAASLIDGQLIATARLGPDQGVWSIQPLTEAVPGAARDQHVVYHSADLSFLDVDCGTPDHGTHTHGASHPGAISSLPLGAHLVCEIGIDTDVQFFNLNGSSVTATQNDITTVMNNVEAIYDSQACILYSITAIIVRTAEPDPYTSSVPSTLLDQFSQEWISNQQAIERDVAHLFTGRNLQGSTIGVAWIGGICALGTGFGLSQSRFTSGLTQRTALTAHELGHNWSSNHCNSSPPCRIMCSGLGGCSGGLTSFGPFALNAILNKRDIAPCLEATVAPVLTSVDADMEVFVGDPVTATGNLFSTVRFLDVNGSVLNWYRDEFTIVDETTIEFPPPASTTLGSVSVKAIGTGGDSNVVSANYVPTDPPALVAPEYVNPIIPFVWEFAADPDDVWFLYLSLGDDTTIPFLGFELLASPFFSGFTGLLSPAGRGTAATFPPLGLFAGLTLYSQIITLDDLTSGFAGATNLQGSLFLF